MVFAPETEMFLTIELPMLTADEWFRRPLEARWKLEHGGPEPAVESTLADGEAMHYHS